MSKNVPLVYIIVLTWNGREDTLECIKSLCQSNYPNYRILLVDNASSDDTVRVVKSEFPDIEVLENPSNLGYAEGNNLGIQYAIKQGAEFLLILNNDIIMDRSAVTILVNATSQDPNAFITTPAVYKYSSPDETAFRRKVWDSTALRFRSAENFPEIAETRVSAGPVVVPSLPTVEMLPTALAPGCSLFLSPAVIRQVGLFDSRFFIYWEETDWCTRAVRQGCRIFLVPAAKVWHKESRSFAKESQRSAYHYYYFRNRLLWIEKNLQGSNRWLPMLRCLRELVKPLHPRYESDLSDGRILVFRARLLGAWHYLIRRFGRLRT